jgi:hypothetical protein
MSRLMWCFLLVGCDAATADLGLADSGGTEPYTRPGGQGQVATEGPAIEYGRREWAAGECRDVTPPNGALLQLLACDDLGDAIVCRPDDEGRLSMVDGVASVLCAVDGEHDSYVLTWIAPA